MAMESVATPSDQEGGLILEVKNLQTAFFTDRETVRAVDGISFDVHAGETVGIVGESGSGKSVTARSVMGLIESPGRILDGSSVRYHDVDAVREYASRFRNRVVDVPALRQEYDPATLLENPDVDATPETFGYDHVSEVSLVDILAGGYGDSLGIIDANDAIFVTEGETASEEIQQGFVELTRLSGESQRLMRGGRIAMVFQDPLTSLNPVFTVGNQLKEALDLHQGLSGNAATQEAAELLEAVGIPDARRRVEEYPHQFSGGMRQRAVIAMALACEPELLICDEPTTALDVTIQAQILDLLAELQEERGIGIIFITHDMGVIADVSDYVNVMYAGEIVETADVYSVFENPRHPYTRGLLESIPGVQEGDRLQTIEGTVPTPTEPATYCRYAPRCPKAFDACEVVHPVHVPVNEAAEGHTAACLLYPEDQPRPAAVEQHRKRGDTRSEYE